MLIFRRFVNVLAGCGGGQLHLFSGPDHLNIALFMPSVAIRLQLRSSPAAPRVTGHSSVRLYGNP